MQYHSRLLRQWGIDLLDDVREFRSGTMLLIAAGVCAIMQNHWHLIKPDQTWQTAVVNATPTVFLFGFYLAWHAVRAPWKLDQERHQAIAVASETVGVLRLKLAAFLPHLDFAGVGVAIKGHNGSTFNNLVIANTNTNRQNSADNVRATFGYRQTAGLPFSRDGVWSGAETDDSTMTSIPGGRDRRLVFILQFGNEFYAPVLSGGCINAGTPLQAGIWEISVEIAGDNCGSISGQSKYRLENDDGRLIQVEEWSFTPRPPKVGTATMQSR